MAIVKIERASNATFTYKIGNGESVPLQRGDYRIYQVFDSEISEHRISFLDKHTRNDVIRSIPLSDFRDNNDLPFADLTAFYAYLNTGGDGDGLFFLNKSSSGGSGAFDTALFKIYTYEQIDISAGTGATTGTLQETPAGATIQTTGELEDNAILLLLNASGYPIDESPQDSGSFITATLDGLGNWNVTGNYPDPVAIVYIYTITGADYANLTANEVDHIIEQFSDGEVVTSNGIIGGKGSDDPVRLPNNTEGPAADFAEIYHRFDNSALNSTSLFSLNGNTQQLKYELRADGHVFRAGNNWMINLYFGAGPTFRCNSKRGVRYENSTEYASFNPDTEDVYIPSWEIVRTYTAKEIYSFHSKDFVGSNVIIPPLGVDKNDQIKVFNLDGGMTIRNIKFIVGSPTVNPASWGIDIRHVSAVGQSGIAGGVTNTSGTSLWTGTFSTTTTTALSQAYDEALDVDVDIPSDGHLIVTTTTVTETGASGVMINLETTRY